MAIKFFSLNILISSVASIHQGHTLDEPVDVYNLLGKPVNFKPTVKFEVCNTRGHISDKYGAQFAYAFGGSASKELKKIISRSLLSSFLTLNDIQKLSRALKNILHK